MKLQFTNGYSPHFDQISRLLNYYIQHEDQKKIIRKDIVSELGIPDKQIENLSSMMVGFGLVFPRSTKVTQLGKVFMQYDPFFERMETLWIIHYIVSSDPNWVVWHRIINQALKNQEEFEVDQVSEEYFLDLSNKFSERTITKKIPTEVSAVFAAYTRTDLSKLLIFSEVSAGKFKKSEPLEIPALAFLYCVLTFLESKFSGSSAINIQDICCLESSPGLVLNLEEYQVRLLIEYLQFKGILRLEQFGNLDQVRISASLTKEAILNRIYVE
jgi:hypothetical protein